MTISGGEVFPSHFCPEFGIGSHDLILQSSTKWPNASHIEKSERHAEAGNRSCVMLLLWVSCCLREYCVVGGTTKGKATQKLNVSCHIKAYLWPKQRYTLFGPCFVRCGRCCVPRAGHGLGRGRRGSNVERVC